MNRDRVRSFRSLTAYSNNSAALPIGGFRSLGRPASVWPCAKALLQSLRLRQSMDRTQMACSLAMLVCGMMLGLFVGGFVGFMENATPHGAAPGNMAQMAAVDAGWAAMMSQTGAPSNGHLQRLAVRSHRPMVTGSYIGWQPVAEASDSRSVVCVGQH